MKVLQMLIILAISNYALAQQTTSKQFVIPETENNMSRYQIDFEIKDMSVPDAERINQLDLDQYENLRKEDEIVEVLDDGTGLIIVFYSMDTTLENKKRNIKAKFPGKQF